MIQTYVVEYILNTDHEWSVWWSVGKGLKTQPMTAAAYLKMDERRRSGEIVILSVEVIK